MGTNTSKSHCEKPEKKDSCTKPLETISKQNEITKNTEQQKCRPCCACLETRRPRDNCLAIHGEEGCTDLILAHKECMKKLGYNI